MKKIHERSPQNVTPFMLGIWRLDAIDKETMAKLSRLARRKGLTVPDYICDCLKDWIADREAEIELETKIIRFPRCHAKPRLRGSSKCTLAKSGLAKIIAASI